MKCVPCFLMMLGFLLGLGTGCSASQHPPKPAAAASTIRVGPTNSEYEALVENSVLVKHLRGEPEIREVSCLCLPTGEFNVAPTGDHLLMETWCVGNLDGSQAVIQVEDKVAPSFSDEPHSFDVPFERAIVSVEDQGGKTVVTLYYKDEGGQAFHVDLPARADAEYAYAFDSLVPSVLWPYSERRTLPIEITRQEEDPS